MRARRMMSCFQRFVTLAVLTCSVPLQAQELVVVLDRPHIIELVREQSPDVLVARARVGEARALRVGASAAAPVNPELGVLAGPHFFSDQTTADFNLSLKWPLDFSSARDARKAMVEESTRAADAEAVAVTRAATAEALVLWVQALGEMERTRIEGERVAVDAGLVRVALAQRKAGTTGDAEVALALVVQAAGRARLQSVEAERDAVLASLRSKLGLGAQRAIELRPTGSDDTAPALPELLSGIPNRADVVRAMARRRVAHADETLQRRLAAPVPRLSVAGGRSGEYYMEGGIEMPLPIYQRNQTNVAVARARIDTSAVEETAARASAGGELHAAYARYLGARLAFATLSAAAPSMADAEHLATRGYELGQGTLASVLAVRREVAAARLALVELQVTLRRARIAVDLAAGILP